MKGHSLSFNFPSLLKNLPSAARLLLCAMLAMLCTAYVAKAQDTGYISGTVTDKSGAVVAGSGSGCFSNSTAVDAHNDPQTRTEPYVVAGLPGGTYDIVVTAKGFPDIYGDIKWC